MKATLGVTWRVTGETDCFEAVLLHLVVLVRSPHVELTQLQHGAVDLSRHVLKHEIEECIVKSTFDSPSLVDSLLQLGELDLDERLLVKGSDTSRLMALAWHCQGLP